jgi:hypothetical protein
MRKQVLVAVVVGALALGLAGSIAWAVGAVSVNIPFSFVAKDKEMTAGTYEIRVEGNNEDQLAIRNIKGSGHTNLQVIERLADTGTKDVRIVFDKTEDGKSYLSEVHIPGTDGFLVGIAKGREKHVVLTGKE